MSEQSNVIQFKPARRDTHIEGDIWDTVCLLRYDYGRREIKRSVRAMLAGVKGEVDTDEGELAAAVQAARAVGWSDKQILECAQIELSNNYSDDD